MSLDILIHDLRCGGKWRKYRRAHEGNQQWRCSKCGKLQIKPVSKVSQFWCMHRKKLDRRFRPPILKCKKCGKQFGPVAMKGKKR